MKHIDKDLVNILKDSYIGYDLINLFYYKNYFLIEIFLRPMQESIYEGLKTLGYIVSQSSDKSFIAGFVGDDKKSSIELMTTKKDFIDYIFSDVEKEYKYIDREIFKENIHINSYLYEEIDDFYLIQLNEDNKNSFSLKSNKDFLSLMSNIHIEVREHLYNQTSEMIKAKKAELSDLEQKLANI